MNKGGAHLLLKTKLCTDIPSGPKTHSKYVKIKHLYKLNDYKIIAIIQIQHRSMF